MTEQGTYWASSFSLEDMPQVQRFRDFVKGLERTKDKSLKERVGHATAGIGSEAGELLGQYKKDFIYPEEETLAVEKWKDELCDTLHYFIMLTNILGITIDELIELNIAKLQERHPGGFTPETALNKDKEKEAKAMENVSKKNSEEE